jgi:hypothetical protein
MMCTFIVFFGVNFSVTAQTPNQCSGGMTVTMTSDLTTVNTAIPFGTPIVVTTTVRNNNSTPRSVTLQLALSQNSAGSQYTVLCAGDYTWSGGILAQRNISNIQPGASVVSTITLVYTQVFLRATSPAGSFVIATIFGNNIPVCNTRLNILPKDTDAVLLGTPNTVTTVNTLLNLTAEGSLIIRGTVILNVDHVLQPIGNGRATFPYIYMDEGATLIIPSGRTMTLKGARVFGIRSMWNSIIVESGGSLITTFGSDGLNTVFRDTRIEDGIMAVEARDGSNISISATHFEDNIRSFYVPPTTTGALQYINFGNAFYACDFNGTGQLRPLPQATHNCTTNKINGYPFAGMDINDLGSLITVGALQNVVKTRFRNMSNGILAKSTRLFVNQVSFENIKSTYSGFDGLGIWSHDPNSLLLVAGNPNPSSTALDFNNCTQGIIVENFGLNDLSQINALRIDNTADAVGVGIKAVNNNFSRSFIYANNIKAKIGILSAWNRFNLVNVGEIYNNFIEVLNPTNPTSSLGILAFENGASGNWRIYDNTIDVQNAQGGIQFNSGTGATVTNNNIILEPSSFSNANGIQAGGSTNFNVSCNDISFLGSPNPNFRSAMFVFSGTGSSYTCNNTSNTEFGLNIVGECRPFRMNANRFNRHFSGLRINDATAIGQQTLRGNKWQGPFTTVGAENLNSNFNDIALSRFYVGSSNAPIMPTFFPSGSGWFQAISGTDLACTDLGACPNGNPAGRLAGGNAINNDTFYRSAISAERMQTPYAEEMKWTAQRNAYGRLMDNPSEQNSRDITTFMGNMRNTSTGQLYQLEKGIKDIQNIGQEYNDVLLTNANTIKTLANEIGDLDAKIFVAKGAEKTALIAQKKEKNATIHRLSTENAPRHAAIESRTKVQIQQLMRENERISTRLQPDANERDVNKIYLETVAQGKKTLNSAQKTTVRTIAYQCPSQGGNAVFAARSLYALVENVNFNDLELCNIHSGSIQGMIVKRVETNFKISPNPAADVLMVSQSTEKIESGEWVIFNTAGKLLLSKKVSENEIQANLNIQGLSEGIYFVSFVVNGEKRFNQKFIKIKSN